MRKVSIYILALVLVAAALPCRADDASDSVRLVKELNGDLSFGATGELDGIEVPSETFERPPFSADRYLTNDEREELYEHRLESLPINRDGH